MASLTLRVRSTMATIESTLSGLRTSTILLNRMSFTPTGSFHDPWNGPHKKTRRTASGGLVKVCIE
jgi:hypothetical protein